MATTVNPITGEILVPRADMPVVQVSPEIRELDVDAWRLELHDIADDVDMRPWPKMFLHNTQYTLSGTTYVRAFQIIDPYFVTFEDAQYAVRLVGGNNNILDVKTANQVSLLASNSAGKQVVNEGGGGGWDDILADHNTAGTFGGAVNSLGYMDHMVYINTENVAAGNGTQNAPFNTLTAAIDFAESKNIRHLIVQADIVIDRQLKTFKITGVGNPTIDCNGQNLTGCEFWHCAMEGSYTGAITVQESILLDGFWLNGFFEKCALNGDLFCTDLGQVNLVKCISNIAGLGRPTISMNAIGTCLLSIRGFNGGMTIKHCNAITDAVTVEISEGALAFDSTNTDGVMVARGFCVFDDTTTGAAVHDQTALPANIQAMLDLMEADEEHTPTSIIKRRKGTIDNLLVKNVAGSNLSKTLTVTQP